MANKPKTNKNDGVSVENTETVDFIESDTADIDINVSEPVVEDKAELTENVNIKEIVADINDSINELSGKEVRDNFEMLAEVNISSNKPIACKSVYFGKVTYVNPITKAKRVWKEYGSVITMPFSEFQIMHNDKPEYFEHPFIIIGDTDVIAYYNQEEMYGELHRITKIDKIILTNNINLIKKELKSIVDIGLKDMLVASLRKMRKDKSLTNKDVIDIVREELNLDLE